MKCRRFRLENGEGVGDRDEVKLLFSSLLFYLADAITQQSLIVCYH